MQLISLWHWIVLEEACVPNYSLLDLGPIAREGGHCSNTCTTTTWIMFGGFQFPNAIFLCIVLLGRGPRKNCKNDLDDQT